MKSHMTNDVAAIEAAKKILDLDQKYEPLRNEIHAKLEAEMKALKEAYEAEHQTLWSELTDKMGIAPSNPLTGFGYQMDKDYMDDHGVLFLKEINSDPDDQCDCPSCEERRSKGYPGGSLADILKDALMGKSVN